MWAWVAAMTGCQTPPSGEGYSPDLAPTLDRIVAAYDDLASKRFEVLASFERPAEETLFRLEPPGGPGAVGMSTERARVETGVGALKMSLVRSSQRVVCADSPDSEWGLPRDFSAYHLLLFSVFSPRNLGGFRFSARSGTDLPLTYEHPRVLLNPGWNLIRIDVGDLGGRIDLTDVRELRFGCDPLETPVDLYLDDVILVDNAREIFASAEREPGDLYVRTQGRRLVAGAIDRFELVFSRGQVRQWFDLGHDPARTHNLLGTGFLGPTPVVVPNDAPATVVLDDASQWSGLGITVESYQSLVEATPLRVVVQGQWRFCSPDAPPTDRSPSHRWVWSIYRDGRVYVECGGTARAEQFDPPGVGVAFCCDGDLGFTREMVEGRPEPGRQAHRRECSILFSQSGPGQADLLIVPFTPLTARPLENPRDPRLCGLWNVPIQGDHFLFAAMIRVWPPDIDPVEQAADYRNPLPITLDAGQLVQTDPGDLDNDGFSESGGYYVFQLDGNIAKVRITGRRQLRFSPVFKLVDVANRHVWVYLDGRLIRDLYRDEDGNVWFEVPGVISHEALLEVTSRLRQ